MVSDSIIKAVQRKEKGSFKEFYNLCIPYVFTVVQRHISNGSDFQDVIQEIFARVFLNIKSFDPKKGEFKYWIRKISVNQCYQHYRKEKTNNLHLELDNTLEIKDEELNLDNLSKDEIEKLLAKMPDGYRRVFLLVIIDEYSHKEVGELLEITPDSSRSQLSRAKKWLRKNTPHTINNLANGY